MPDLGKYAAEVAAAYGLSGLCLAVIVIATLWRGARVKRALHEAEARKNG